MNFVAGKKMPSVDRPLTTAQRDLLVDVQFKRRVLAGRDTLYTHRSGLGSAPLSARRLFLRHHHLHLALLEPGRNRDTKIPHANRTARTAFYSQGWGGYCGYGNLPVP